MKKVIRSNIFECENNNYKIWGGNQPKYWEILNSLHSQLTNMLSHHQKVLAVRLDFHQYEFTQDNQCISLLLKILKKRLKQHYKINRTGYLWVREIGTQAKSGQHYHLLLLLNGHIIQHPGKVIKFIEAICLDRELGFCYTPKNCYYRLKRGDITQFEKTFYRCSYLAKTATKGRKQITANDYSSSRIKKRLIKQHNL